METRKITLSDLLTVIGEKENIALYKACDEGKRFIVNIECESAKKYLSKDILDDEVEIVEGVCSKGVKITLKREGL